MAIIENTKGRYWKVQGNFKELARKGRISVIANTIPDVMRYFEDEGLQVWSIADHGPVDAVDSEVEVHDYWSVLISRPYSTHEVGIVAPTIAKAFELAEPFVSKGSRIIQINHRGAVNLNLLNRS